MGWRDADDERTIGVHDHLFDAVEAAIGAEERSADGDAGDIEAVMTPHALELGPRRLEWPVALVLGASEIVVARGRGFRRRTPEVTTIARDHVTDPGEPTAGTDCFVVTFRHATFGDCLACFGLVHEAEYFSTNLWRDELAAPTGTLPVTTASLPPPPAPALSARPG